MVDDVVWIVRLVPSGSPTVTEESVTPVIVPTTDGSRTWIRVISVEPLLVRTSRKTIWSPTWRSDSAISVSPR